MFPTIRSRSLLATSVLAFGITTMAFGQASIGPAPPNASPNPGASTQMPRSPGAMNPPGTPNPGLSTPSRPYNELDTDHDGNLSVEEYEKLSPDVPYASIDTNRDGRVSDKEYRDALEKRKPSGSTPTKPGH